MKKCIAQMLAVNVDPKYLTIEQVTRAHKHSTILPPSRAIYTIYSIHPGERGLRRNSCPRDDTWLFGTHHCRWREQFDAGRRFVGLAGPASTASAPWWTPPCRRKPRGFLALVSSVFSKKTTRGERRATRAFFLQRPRAATVAPPCPPVSWAQRTALDPASRGAAASRSAPFRLRVPPAGRSRVRQATAAAAEEPAGA
jgi:hypothetical protein